MDYLLQLTSIGNFMPHGMCYMWRWDLLLLHVGSDLLIAGAYFSIPAAMLVLVKRRPDIPRKIFLLFVGFIMLCGITHVISIIVVWHPIYAIQGIFKLATGVVSVATAVYLWPLIPKVVAMPSVTDLEKRNQEIESLNTKLESRLESLSTLAGGVSHEFNNLLTIISGNVEILKESQLSPDDHYRLDSIASASNRAADICNKMLAYSGRGHFVLSEFNLGTFLAGIKFQVPEDIQFRVNVKEALKPINGSQRQIEQLARILVSNAAEAFESSDRENKQISLSIHSQYFQEHDLAIAAFETHVSPGEFIVLEVADNGAGISGEVREHLFDPYFTTKFTGRGLGLSAAQGIVRGHGAVMFVDTRVGEGTTMRIAFPAVAAETRLYREPSKKRPQMALVVDDEQSILDLAEAYLHTLNIKVVTASSADQALELVAQHKDELDLIILDYLMPNMTGLELLGSISEMLQVDTYLTSGYTRGDIGDEDTLRLLTGFIAKPFTFKDFQKLFARQP